MATITWQSATSGNWSVGANWVGGVAPKEDDDALINVPGAYLITAANVTVNSVTLDDAAGEIFAAGGLSVATGMVISAGTLLVDTGGSVAAGNLINAGTIIDNGVLTAHIEDATALDRIGGSGTLFLDAAFVNFGTVDLPGPVALPELVWQGTLEGGTLHHLGGQVANTLTLANVELGGSLLASQATLLFDGGVTFAGAEGSGAGTLDLFGMFNPDGVPSEAHFNGSQTLDNALVSANGALFEIPDTLTLGDGLTLHAAPVLHSLALEIDGAGTLVNDGTIDLESRAGVSVGVANFINADLIAIRPTANGVVSASFGVTSGVFSNLAAGRVEVADGFMQLSAPVVENAGTIATTGALATVAIRSGTLTNMAGALISADAGGISFLQPVLNNLAGAAIRSAGGTIVFGSTLALTSDGTIAAAGGLIDIEAASLGGSGLVTLSGNGAVEVGGAASGTETFDFTGAGTLILEQPAFVASTIRNFSPDDTIRLGVAATAVSYTDGDLKMQTTGGQAFDLAIIGPLTLGDFIVSGDGSTTTLNLACFAEGSRIRTDEGDVPVERLRVGDGVVLAGSAHTLPVVWIGHRGVDCRRHPDPASVWPVRIAAHAFAAGVPQHDLYLSPDHAVFVDGVLIPVKYLVNDSTITRQERKRVTYYHVELPRHAVLLAEGLPAESRLPMADRSAYANGGGPVALYPDFHSHAWEALGCAPLVVTGPVLEAVRARLHERSLPGARRTSEPVVAA
ncbi:MAG: Hint domain-containing protein [Acetobacteraceae bacterium]